MNCPTDDQLHAFMLGVPTAEEDSIGQHLEDCSDCVARVDTLSLPKDDVVERLRTETPLSSRVQLVLEQYNDKRDRTAAIETGRCIGGYEILCLLGRGAMGDVYRALQLKLDRRVAFKVIRRHYVPDDDSVRRFQKSAKAMGKLDHPHVVRAIDAREDEGICYLTMELVEGLNADELVQRVGPLPIADACEIIRQAAEGLAHGHSHRCVHRDVKPSNLMIDATGTVKVTDFGLATLRPNVWDPDSLDEQETMEGTILGTPDYMAPEQFQDAHNVDGRADVYSLGCTLFKLLSGRTPFNTGEPKTLYEKMKDHFESPPVSLQTLRDDIPDALGKLVGQMLAKELNERTSSTAEVAKQLEPFCVGSGLSKLVARANSLTPGYTTATRREIKLVRETSRPSWTRIGGLGAGVVVTLLAIAVWYHFGVASSQPTADRGTNALVNGSNTTGSREWILDDTDAELTSEPGTNGWRVSSLKVGYGGSHTYNEDGAEIARWTISVPTGKYSVYATWPELNAEQCAETVVFRLYAGSRVLSVINISQQQPAADVRTNDCGWALLDRIDITVGPLVVEVDAQDSHGPGAIRLDAVRVVREAESATH